MMMMGMGDQFADVFEAAKQAGIELARDGKISDATLAVVSRDIMDVDTFSNQANKYFTKVLEDLKAKQAG
jgi:hypothetical protein